MGEIDKCEDLVDEYPGTDAKLTNDMKAFAIETLCADLVGVAPIERFKGAPEENQPTFYMPDAKSVIVLASRILPMLSEVAGHYTEPGKTLEPYMWFGYPMLNWNLSWMAIRVAKFLDLRGYQSLPFPPTTHVGWRSKELFADFSHRHAAVAAGLGEFGLNRLLLTPEFGPRQRLLSMITQAPLVPDPLYTGPKLCRPDVCGQPCLKLCPSGALARTQSCEIGNRVFKYSRLHIVKCSWSSIHEKGFQRTHIPMPSNPTWDDLHAAFQKRDIKDSGLELMTAVGKCGACLNFCPAPEFKPERIEALKKRAED